MELSNGILEASIKSVSSEIYSYSGSLLFTNLQFIVMEKGWKLLLLSPYYIAKKLAVYNPQFIVIRKKHKEAFVTLNSRANAEQLVQDALVRRIFGECVQISYASNYGLGARCIASYNNEVERRSGVYKVCATNVLRDSNPTFRIWAAREVGRSGLEPLFRNASQHLTRRQLSLAREFGDLWLGGLIIEEPYKPSSEKKVGYKRKAIQEFV
ncbi:hypothetical protein MIR68_004885 [Amoeboaphelidium protococcarum]|nr:hypothetical protein MIR68_004885 [Amoeboaphelidium protococcarum]